jgi:hypothetical protein
MFCIVGKRERMSIETLVLQINRAAALDPFLGQATAASRMPYLTVAKQATATAEGHTDSLTPPESENCRRAGAALDRSEQVHCAAASIFDYQGSLGVVGDVGYVHHRNIDAVVRLTEQAAWRGDPK